MNGVINDELILKIGRGDADSLACLYDMAKGSIYGFALSILKNSHEAEDIMQDTFVKVYKAADTYQPQGKPMAWILTITRNLCMSKLRSDRHHEDLDDLKHSLADSQKDPIDAIVIEEALTVLDDLEKEIVLLHSLTGMKHREIADLLEIPLSTCLSKYHRSLKKMRKKLIQDGV